MADGFVGPGTLAPAGIEDLQLIGRGGAATLYRGRQPAFHRDVAVKILDAGMDAGGPGRFSKEIRALGSLSGHPHVVPLYDAGELEGHPYLVMPFLSGGSLADRLLSGPLPADEVTRIGVAVADALEAAHALGMLHRDIKPANVLFNAYGEGQLADFGIARFADSTQTHGLVAATVGYAAPEVLSGAAATPAADVYSLGATLHAALRGSPPFTARPEELAIAFAVRVMQSEAPPLQGVPPALAAVVRTAMAKDPAQRYPTAAAMKAALMKSDSRRPEPPPAPVAGGQVERAETPPRRSRQHAAVIAAILALAGGGAAAAAALTTGGHGTPGPAASRAPSASTTSVPARQPPVTSPPSTSPPRSTPATTVASPPAPAPAPDTTPTTAGGAAGGASRSPARAPGSVAAYVRSYYALVDAHSLSQSWTWLSTAYQQRLGYGYYQQFWNSVASVDILHVAPGTRQANITIRYHMADGSSQTEQAVLSFTTDPTSGRRLIDNTTVVG